MTKVRISYPDGHEEIVDSDDAMTALAEKFPEAEVVCNGGHCWIEDEDITADAFETRDEDTETWTAWLDGRRDQAVEFEVPLSTPFDVAEAGARALGIEVCAELNVKRV